MQQTGKLIAKIEMDAKFEREVRIFSGSWSSFEDLSGH
jgi:hypothetical protein